jgi:hypothetical protein
MAEGANNESLQAFLPLLAPTSDFVSSLLSSSHSLSLRILTIEFLTCLMKSGCDLFLWGVFVCK